MAECCKIKHFFPQRYDTSAKATSFVVYLQLQEDKIFVLRFWLFKPANNLKLKEKKQGPKISYMGTLKETVA